MAPYSSILPILNDTSDNFTYLISYFIQTSFKAFQISLSLYSANGSKLYLIDSENRTGSCGMMEIFDLTSCNPRFFVSKESMIIAPSK